MKVVDYIKETKTELRHVNWPTKTGDYFYRVVIAVSIGVSLFLGFDFLFLLLSSRYMIRKVASSL